MKHSKKKIVSAVIALGILTSAFAVVASAADETTATPAPTATSAPLTPAPDLAEISDPVKVNGSVSEIGENSITLKNDDKDAAYPEITLNISEQTVLIDFATGKKASFSDIKEKDGIIAYTSAAMTKSIPPQSHAMVVLCNVPKDTKDNVVLAEIKSTTPTDKGYFLETDQKLMLNVSDATEMASYGTDNAVSADSLEKGMKVMAWYETVSETSPKQTEPSRLIVVPEVKEPDVKEPDVTTPEPVNPLACVRVFGNVVEINEKSITLKNDNENDHLNHVVVHVAEDTYILDPVTGTPKTLADIKENDSVTAYVGPAMTMSLPPQSTAVVLFTAPPADFAVPTYAKITKVTKDDEGTYTIETDQNVIMHITADTEVVPYLTKNIVTAEDLAEGSEIIAWYDVVALSEPAQATPTKIMLLDKVEKEPVDTKPVIEADINGITINGEAVVLTENEKPYTEDNILMVPLRKFAQALGCEVNWDGENIMITVKENGEVLYKVKGNTKTVTDTQAVTELEKTATITDNGVTFTAFSDMLKLHNAITK